MKGISNYTPTSRMKDKRQRREQQKAEAKVARKAQTSPAPTKCCGEDCPCDDHAANTRRVTFAQDEPFRCLQPGGFGPRCVRYLGFITTGNISRVVVPCSSPPF